MELLISILALVISILSLIATAFIYSREKNEAIIQSFFNDFASFLSYAGQGRNKDAFITLTKLKIQIGFLKTDLYDEFLNLLPIIEHLNLTNTNPNLESDRFKIESFILNFTKSYNTKSKLSIDYLSTNLLNLSKEK